MILLRLLRMLPRILLRRLFNSSLPDDQRPRESGTPLMSSSHWSYNALKDTGNDQVLNFSGWDFNGDINSPKGVRCCLREKGSNTPSWLSATIEYNDPSIRPSTSMGSSAVTLRFPLTPWIRREAVHR